RGCGGRRIGERERQVRMAQALAESMDPPAPPVAAATDARAAELARLAASRFPAVRAAAAAGADAATTRRLLGDGEAEVVAAAAERAATLRLTSAAPELTAALERLAGPDAIEARQAILATASELQLTALIPAAQRLVDVEPYGLRLAVAQSLTKLTGAPVHARLPSLDPADASAPVDAAGGAHGAGASAGADASAGASVGAGAAIVRLRTTRGIIRVRLWTADAPRTTGNFVTLVRRHFYDGLPFHRVVPDFVSQSGDPRGDGSGGPGYALRCEIGMRRYEAGVIGMALAGRDTGGSQFFFTQSPQPHLDGRYTAFGQVVAGGDVVRGLIEGDVVLEARLE
ncbi:MAG TPA: peptidylprolyl isomerase, partial [Polyangia bacterium]|nr:peptidylprolyl isomerase [Polyangia bacterium]